MPLLKRSATTEYERILSAIVSMKDIYKEVMYYHFVMDLSIPEVAKMLNCKVSTVKQRLVRGKKLLYAQLFGGESNDSRE
ncbi:MAG: RNA polymerase sigma factor [Acutalibacteraceae bacterium]